MVQKYKTKYGKTKSLRQFVDAIDKIINHQYAEGIKIIKQCVAKGTKIVKACT
jgi:hypothetical protein